MEYYIEAQYLPKGASRPLDDGATLDISTDDKGFALVPAVGDYVQIGVGMNKVEGRTQFSGKVVSRLFRYIGTAVAVNIVVAEEDIDWGRLIKE